MRLLGRLRVSAIVLCVSYGFCGVLQPAFSEDLGSAEVNAQKEAHPNPPPPLDRRVLCDSLGAASCFRALARGMRHEPATKETPTNLQ
jgi:hypothetical protein